MASPAAPNHEPHLTRQAQSADERFGTLRAHEERWRNRQPFFQSHGYTLRPRYHPEWVPSWRSTGRKILMSEDYIVLLGTRHNLIDATRTSDGKMVYIKRVQSGGQEVQLATMLSAEHLRKDPRNHCVEIYEVLQDPDDATVSYMIMPFLRYIDKPDFETVENILDFGTQILEGLAFLHEQGVAHRDCSYKNIMMDASQLYPRGFHPIQDRFLPDISGPAPVLPRSAAPVRYYFVDFGISSFFPKEVASRHVVGVHGLDQEVPELSDDVPYDPFKVDIFIIGNLLKNRFYAAYSNVDFLWPIITYMTQRDPASRPDAAEALRQWEGIRSDVSTIRRLWRLRQRRGPLLQKAYNDAVSLVKAGFNLSNGWIGCLTLGLALYSLASYFDMAPDLSSRLL